jgi:hypothetical protein
VQITFGNNKKHSISLVIRSLSDSNHFSTRIAFSDCHSQLSRIWCRYLKSCFGCIGRIQAWPFPSLFCRFPLPNLKLLVGLSLWSIPWVSIFDQVLSIGTLNKSIRLYHMDLLLWWDCGSYTPESYRGSSHSEHWQFNARASPSYVIFRYHAFLLNSLKVDGIASPHLLAPYHMHYDCTIS